MKPYKAKSKEDLFTKYYEYLAIYGTVFIEIKENGDVIVYDPTTIKYDGTRP